MKKFLKITSLCIVFLLLSCLISGVAIFLVSTSNVTLSPDKLKFDSASAFKIYGSGGDEIKPSGIAYSGIDTLSTYTKDAFVCAEDKRFYSHSGIDYIRIGGAIISNLKSHSFSQGASTISQQLIKNTHLSSEKTISRKLKEFKLTKQLEKAYSKDQILEMYVNNIYFGNGCYGIENAAKHYFSKPASALTLSESALLAGTINAPGVYDIQNSTEKALQRRNLILKLMYEQGKISKEQFEQAQSEEIKLNLTKISGNDYVYGEVIAEACKLLKKTENELNGLNIKIQTYIDTKLQEQINSAIKQKYGNVPSHPDIATIISDNQSGGIIAAVGSKKAFLTKKQPGSLIKPILVYGAAIESGTISPATKILDSKTDFGGYVPENADKKSHGYMSAREALTTSNNVIAIKLLNEIGISRAKQFAQNLGIEFSEKDNHLALALGGFSDGVTLKQLLNAYACFARGGSYLGGHFIKSITKDGKTIYNFDDEKKAVMSDSTAYLVSDILKGTSKTGTAKRLKVFDFDVASKTGTVGLASSNKNSEAFSAAYTTSHTIISYFGGKVMPESVNGATYPTMLTKDILEALYSEQKPANFAMPNSVTEKQISKSDYEKNVVSLTDDPSDAISEVFAKNNVPKLATHSLCLTLNAFNFPTKKPILSFFESENYSCKLFRKGENGDEVIYEKNANSGQRAVQFEDKTAISEKIYEYYVEFKENSSGKIYKSNTVKLKAF